MERVNRLLNTEIVHYINSSKILLEYGQDKIVVFKLCASNKTIHSLTCDSGVKEVEEKMAMLDSCYIVGCWKVKKALLSNNRTYLVKPDDTETYTLGQYNNNKWEPIDDFESVEDAMNYYRDNEKF